VIAASTSCILASVACPALGPPTKVACSTWGFGFPSWKENPTQVSDDDDEDFPILQLKRFCDLFVVYVCVWVGEKK